MYRLLLSIGRGEVNGTCILRIRLAHLSDVHLPPLPPGSILGGFEPKRLLGGLNWKLRRHRWHDRTVADLVVRDIITHQPDLVALTGDIVNLSAPAEFEQAATWLRGFGPPDWISFVPGNHDAYAPVPWKDGLAHFAPYMTGSLQLANGFTSLHNAQPFPYVRFRGNLAVVGLTTALPQPLGKATGSLGKAQLNLLPPLLRDLKLKGCYRAVLIHHPPLPGETPASKAMLDAAEFAAIVAEEGAELIIHGHTHRNSRNTLPGPSGPVPVVGVAAASMVASDKRQAASWNLFEITRSDGRWHTALTTRTYSAESRNMGFLEQILLP